MFNYVLVELIKILNFHNSINLNNALQNSFLNVDINMILKIKIKKALIFFYFYVFNFCYFDRILRVKLKREI